MELTTSQPEHDYTNKRSFLRRLARWTGPVMLVSIVAFLIGFVFFAERIARMRMPEDVEAADALVVLTGGQSRLETGIYLLANLKGKRLLISGVNTETSKNSLISAIGADKQLFECCVDVGYEARDTVGNAAETASWLKRHGFKSVILITNNYHMPRSLHELRRQDRTLDIRPYPVVNTNLSDGRWMLKQDTVRVLLAEYMKYIGSKLRGVLPIPASLSSILGQ